MLGLLLLLGLVEVGLKSSLSSESSETRADTEDIDDEDEDVDEDEEDEDDNDCIDVEVDCEDCGDRCNDGCDCVIVVMVFSAIRHNESGNTQVDLISISLISSEIDP